MQQLKLEVLTPERSALDKEVDAVYVEGSEGRLGILPNHTAFISLLNFGMLWYEAEGKRHELLCGEGMVETVDNRVTVLARSAEFEEEIDVQRAKSALERAKSRYYSRGKDVNTIRAEAALKRAIERLKFTNAM